MKTAPLFSIEIVDECYFDNAEISYSLDKEQMDNLFEYIEIHGDMAKDNIVNFVASMMDEFARSVEERSK